MSTAPVCLTLIASRELRDELFDYLGEQADIVSGFTATDAAGHGHDVRLQTQAERVRGHADQVVVRIVLPQLDATRLLDRIKVSLAGTRLVYWIVPVTEFGTID
ncbi:DUF3240 domain-containing protein [Bradyrhizobium guangdongense]|uniref:DUF3240 family protein n=1 Tax=Bradyrhizobium guangdongense TaxID=1325090 RepID=UPI00112A56E6|nr:DUF3240 family protein [Bradyrhizobium guangdongense]TPQ33895.1 DUF3240 domain-containing protein [Bradyrhizobium guangdongense]